MSSFNSSGWLLAGGGKDQMYMTKLTERTFISGPSLRVVMHNIFWNDTHESGVITLDYNITASEYDSEKHGNFYILFIVNVRVGDSEQGGWTRYINSGKMTKLNVGSYHAELRNVPYYVRSYLKEKNKVYVSFKAANGMWASANGGEPDYPCKIAGKEEIVEGGE